LTKSDDRIGIYSQAASHLCGMTAFALRVSVFREQGGEPAFARHITNVRSFERP